jgi:hypothetical protein
MNKWINDRDWKNERINERINKWKNEKRMND